MRYTQKSFQATNKNTVAACCSSVFSEKSSKSFACPRSSATTIGTVYSAIHGRARSA